MWEFTAVPWIVPRGYPGVGIPLPQILIKVNLCYLNQKVTMLIFQANRSGPDAV